MSITATEIIKSNILELEESLKKDNPNIEVLLRDIHSNLRKNPEVCTLLSEEEICTVIKGLEKMTTIEIVTSKPKGKSTKSLGEDDL